jgi:ribonuclease E
MGKRQTSKHAASGLRASAAGLRRLLVALLCCGLVFALSGFALPSATAATRLLSALGAALVVYAGLAIARARPRGAQAGRRRAVAAPVAAEPVQDLDDAQPSFLDEALVVDEDAETAEDAEDVEDAETAHDSEGSDEARDGDVVDADEADAEATDDSDTISIGVDLDVDEADVVEEIDPADGVSGIDADVDTDAGTDADTGTADTTVELPDAAPDTYLDTEAVPEVEPEPEPEAEAPEAPPALLLEELIRQAMAEELANATEQDQPASADLTPEPADEDTVEDGALVPDVVTHDLVPISSLHEARAEAERVSLQRIQATVRGLSVRTGDDPVAVDVLARVVAAVDRLMAPDTFARPALSETAPLLAAAAAATPLPAPSASEETPSPAVPAMRPSDMPVTELTATRPVVEVPDEAPAPMTDTQPIEAVVVEEDPDLVLPIPAPPKPQPAPRGRRLRRHSVA